MRKETRIKRLTELKYMLENHDTIFGKKKLDKKLNTNGKITFYIGTWATTIDCKTAACALGSACYYKPFAKAGLHLDIRLEPRYKGRTEWNAGVKFFGISYNECEFLFSPPTYQALTYKFCYQFSKKMMEKHKIRNVQNYNVEPKHVAKRVAILLKHYKTTNKPLSEIIGD